MPPIVGQIKTYNQRVLRWLYGKWLALTPKGRRLTIAVFLLIVAYALAQLCEVLPDELVKPCHAADQLIKNIGRLFLGVGAGS